MKLNFINPSHWDRSFFFLAEVSYFLVNIESNVYYEISVTSTDPVQRNDCFIQSADSDVWAESETIMKISVTNSDSFVFAFISFEFAKNELSDSFCCLYRLKFSLLSWTKKALWTGLMYFFLTLWSAVVYWTTTKSIICWLFVFFLFACKWTGHMF